MAGTYTVTNLNDSGSGSLRHAIDVVNAYVGAFDKIVFQTGLTGTITLSSELTLSQDVTIIGDTNGDKRADITISGNDVTRIFRMTGSTTDVDLKSLTLTHGNSGSFDGGAIFNRDAGATLDIIDTTVTDSAARGGGGISAYGALRLINSTVVNNHASQTGGGLLLGTSATLQMVNSTISGNIAVIYGGAIDTVGGNTLTISNSAISGNSHSSSNPNAGGISLYDGSHLTMTNSVVAQNTGGTNADISESGSNSTLDVTNSFIGSSSGLVLDTSTSNGFGNAMLGGLADNGGTVQTHSLLTDSPLRGAGDASLRPADSFDLDGDGNTAELLPLGANGSARVNGLLDIGAFEADSDLVVTTAGDDSVGANLAADRADGGGLSLREAIAWAASDAKIGFSSSLAGQTLRLQSELAPT